MEELLHTAAHAISLLVEAIAIGCVAFGALEALVRGVPTLFRGDATGMDRRDVWLRFARWLVAALTFQLGADIVSTSFSATWEDIGRLAAIAVVRTFLSYFLDREVDETRELQYARARERRAERADGRPPASAPGDEP
ncbi:MAG: DUF1622 domain-containing protein [Proteobacteria bacterium]|nr:DUF1622 domain-containing protein [Pseudomonadota bacterium]